MKPYIFKRILPIIVIMLALICACSDNSTDSKGKPTGDPDDPAYVMAKEVLDSADWDLSGAFVWTWIHFRKTTYEAPEPPVYHSSSGYWYRSDTQYQGTSAVTITDSFQLWHGGTPVQYADSAQLTKIVAGFHIHAYVSDTHDTITANYDLTFSGNAGDVYAGDDITGNISGDYYAHYHGPIEGHDTLGVCETKATLVSESVDLTLYMWDMTIDGMYPSHGKYLESGMIYIDPPDPEDDVESGNPWSSSRTFDGEYISTTVYQNESSKWTVVDTLDMETNLPD